MSKPRHCSAEDTASQEIWEVDGESATDVLVSAAFYARELEAQGRSFYIDHHRDNGDDGGEAYEVILFTVDK